VHRPEIAGQRIIRAKAAFQLVFQPIEIERCANPGNADDEVRPAQQQAQPSWMAGGRMTTAMYDAAQTVPNFRNIVGAIRMYGATDVSPNLSST
jgi:hypothetical protein